MKQYLNYNIFINIKYFYLKKKKLKKLKSFETKYFSNESIL